DVGSARIKHSSIPQLNEIGAVLQEIPGKIRISWHTDKQPFKGHSREQSSQLNLALSKDRAKTAADYLIRMGISRNRIQTQGFGSNEPVAYGNSPDDYAKKPSGGDRGVGIAKSENQKPYVGKQLKKAHKMTKTEIEKYLEQLNDKLASMNVKGEICLYGGAAIVFQKNNFISFCQAIPA
ncbi:MAG: hypothetical protein B6245_15045, partial [Desulfobacteraceae bacterium 4572_88]